MKRVKRRIKECPNPLFESWLREWKEEAKRNGSEMQYCFGRALKSLQKFPVRLETGKECFILENFGTKLCMMLDKRLDEYNKERQRTDVSPNSAISLSASITKTEADKLLGAMDRVGDSMKKNLDFLSEDFEENCCGTTSVIGEMANKRKGCMDSPVRSLKLPRENINLKKVTEKNEASTYLPAYRSGGYAILLTLLKNSNEMTKSELETQAQNLCRTSCKKLSSMSTLIKKGLIDRSGRPARYRLTTKGMETAVQLQSMKGSAKDDTDRNFSSIRNEKKTTHSFTSDSINFNLSIETDSCVERTEDRSNFFIVQDNSDKVVNERQSERITAELPTNKAIKRTKKLPSEDRGKASDDCQSNETVFLLPNTFDVILYVDTQEIEKKQNVESDKIVKYLRKRNVNFEVKHLNIGDYVWVCRDSSSGRELVLPYIVERKRMDDLGSSIKDGRFHEQKFRLKQCGLQHCIYLVEKYGNDCHRLGLPLPTIQQAISNTKVVDRFDVKLTNSNEDSLNYLCIMTNFLTTLFKDKTLMSCSKKELPPFSMSNEITSLMLFSDFNKESGKMRKFTVRNMLVKHLLQFSGLSVEKASAIVKVFPTPKSLIEALQGPKGITALTSITSGALSRSIGPALAKSIHRLYTSPTLT